MIFESTFPQLEIPSTPLHSHVLEHSELWDDEPAIIAGVTGRITTLKIYSHPNWPTFVGSASVVR